MTTYLSQANWDSILLKCKQMQRLYSESFTDKEDALSEAVCELLCTCCNEDTFTSELHLCRYLVRAAEHNLLDEHRRKRKFVDVKATDEEEADIIETDNILELPSQCNEQLSHLILDFNYAMARMQPKNALFLKLSMQGYTATEIAVVLGVHPETAAKTIQRTRTALRNMLASYQEAI